MAGSQSKRQSRFVPIFTNRFFSGIWTQRNPLRDAGSTRLEEKFYGSRGDSLIDGLNVELSNKLTLQRRPGSSVYNYQTFPAINSFYEFRQYQASSSSINIIADTASVIYDATGPYSNTAIFTKSPHAGQAYFQSVGNFLYFGDGYDQDKYFSNNGNYLTQLWGIASATEPPTVVIPTGSPQVPTILSSATAALDVAFTGVVPDIPAIPTLTVPITMPVTSAATITPTGTTYIGSQSNIGTGNCTISTSGIAVYTYSVSGLNPGFNIPAGATLNSVTVNYVRAVGGNSAYGITTSANLLEGSTILATVNFPSGDNWTNGFGGAPTAGTALFSSIPLLTVAQVNSATFGCQVNFQYGQANYGSSSVLGLIGSYTITVNYTVPGTPATPWAVNSWNNPSNAVSPSASTDIISQPNTVYDTLVIGGFQLPGPVPLTIPLTNIVNGISIFFNYVVSYISSNGPIAPLIFTLYSNGIQIGSKVFNPIPPPNSSPVGFNLGGAADLWGAGTITPSQVNAGLEIGVSVQSDNIGIIPGEVAADQFLGQFSISLYTSYPSNVTVGSGGTLSGAIGYQYVYSYGNSLTNHISTASAPTNTTGPIVNSVINVGVVASSDPQVNQIWVFRTVDGGSTYFALPTSPYPNVTTTITDEAPNTGSGGLNLSLIAPIADANDPPPIGLINLTYNQGSIWGSIGNTVYFSRWPDGSMGVPVESFPPDNYFIFPSTVTTLVPSSFGILVFTTSDLYLISGEPGTSPAGTAPGSPPPGAYQAGIFLTRLGLLHSNAVTINGTILYLFTSDSQFISLDPSSGVSELGMPIGDLLDGTNTTATVQPVYSPLTAYVTWHVKGSADKAVYLSNGTTGWFRLTPTAAPETGFTWSPFAQITNGCQAVQSVEISPGTYSLLIGPGATPGPILQRNTSVFSDNNIPYTAFATFGSIVLAQPGQMAELASIVTDSMAVGTRPSLSVILDEIDGTFQPLLNYVPDPTPLFPSQSLYADRYYFSQNTSITAWCRHMQIQLSWPAEAYKSELLSLTVIGAHWAEL